MNCILVSKDQRVIKPLSFLFEQKNLGTHFLTFSDILSARTYVDNNPVDVVFADSDIENVDYMTFFHVIKKLRPALLTVLITADAWKAGIAVQKGTHQVLFKPFSLESMDKMFDTLFLFCSHLRRRINVKTFPNFDVFIDDTPVVFGTKRAKELLAYLVFRRGAMVNSQEIILNMFESFDGSVSECSNFRMAVKHLRETLEKHQIKYILKTKKGIFGVATGEFSCDYYDFLDAHKNAVFDYQGRFLDEYAWAEDTRNSLWERKLAFLQAESKKKGKLSESIFPTSLENKWEVFNQLPVPIVVAQINPFDNDIQPCFMNDAFCELTEFDRGTDLTPFRQMRNSFFFPVHEEDVSAIRYLADTLKTGESTSCTFRLCTTKTKKYISLTAKAYLTVENGVKTYYIVYYT